MSLSLRKLKLDGIFYIICSEGTYWDRKNIEIGSNQIREITILTICERVKLEIPTGRLHTIGGYTRESGKSPPWFAILIIIFNTIQYVVFNKKKIVLHHFEIFLQTPLTQPATSTYTQRLYGGQVDECQVLLVCGKRQSHHLKHGYRLQLATRTLFVGGLNCIW